MSGIGERKKVIDRRLDEFADREGIRLVCFSSQSWRRCLKVISEN